MFDTIPDGAEQLVGRDVTKFTTIIFDASARSHPPVSSIVDRISILIEIDGHRPCGDVRGIVNETLDFIRARNLAIELSTAGWRKPVDELYPSDEIIRLAIKKGIPFTTASDAHSHAQLGENYDRLTEKMLTLGIREVCITKNTSAKP